MTQSSFTAKIPPSPVCAAFSGIQWDPLDRLRLTNVEKSLLRSGEDNPVDYTLANPQDAYLYVRALLKVLAEASGPSGPSVKVSKLREVLPVEEALQNLYVDITGVVTHYAISKLYEVITSLREKKGTADVSMITAFYHQDNDTVRGNRLIDDWRPLLRILHLGGEGDPYAQRAAALCLTYILLVACPSQGNTLTTDYSSAEEPLAALVSWITSRLQSSLGESVSLVTPTLTALAICPEARQIFTRNGGIGYIVRHLRSNTSNSSSSNNKSRRKETGATVQQLYELCFCLWAMTYDCSNSATIRAAFARDGAVRSFCDLIASAPREKVVRVALSALRNLAECTADDTDMQSATSGFGEGAIVSQNNKVVNGSVFLNEMIGSGLVKSVDFMLERQWSDPDIIGDLNALCKLLRENYKEMSRWDIYEAEVYSGSLAWGILHTEKFFRENHKKFEGLDGNFTTLKKLITLTTGNDDDVAAIACYDIGEFVRYYPNGRMITNQLGAKDVIMKLINHDNEELQRHALQCVSKIMVQNWAAVQ